MQHNSIISCCIDKGSLPCRKESPPCCKESPPCSRGRRGPCLVHVAVPVSQPCKISTSFSFGVYACKALANLTYTGFCVVLACGPNATCRHCWAGSANCIYHPLFSQHCRCKCEFHQGQLHLPPSHLTALPVASVNTTKVCIATVHRGPTDC